MMPPPLAVALVAPLGLQAGAMMIDELVFHRRRGLGRWERIGHPLDTLAVALCLAWLLAMPCTPGNAAVYAGLAAGSCLLVTKDEAVHARRCSAGEHWLHAILFVLHPLCLGVFGLAWLARDAGAETAWLARLRPLADLLPIQLVVTAAFALYQTLYWNIPWPSRRSPLVLTPSEDTQR